MKLGKLNALIPVIVILIAVALLFVSQNQRVSGTKVDEVIITVDNSEYARVPLSEQQTITIQQDNGAVNVIEITGTGVYMKESTCHNQQCVHMGEVNLTNRQFRINGDFIICLPNRVTIELRPAEE